MNASMHTPTKYCFAHTHSSATTNLFQSFTTKNRDRGVGKDGSSMKEITSSSSYQRLSSTFGRMNLFCPIGRKALTNTRVGLDSTSLMIPG